MVHILLKPSLEKFEHYFASVWDECNCAVVWAFFGIGMKTDLFQSCGHYWVFHICWHTECSTFTASSFRIWNRSTGIPSPALALFVVIRWSHEMESSWMGLVPLSKSWELVPPCTPPYGDIVYGEAGSLQPKRGSHQKANILAPWSQTWSLQN